MPRIEIVGIEPTESAAACAVLELAEKIQDLVHYEEGQAISQVTIKACCKAYRVIRPIVNYYWGPENTVLCWDPPDYKFQPKAKAKC
jgi:hypothetical protein